MSWGGREVSGAFQIHTCLHAYWKHSILNITIVYLHHCFPIRNPPQDFRKCCNTMNKGGTKYRVCILSIRRCMEWAAGVKVIEGVVWLYDGLEYRAVNNKGSWRVGYDGLDLQWNYRDNYPRILVICSVLLQQVSGTIQYWLWRVLNFWCIEYLSIQVSSNEFLTSL